MIGTTLGLLAHASLTPHVHGSANWLVLAAGVILAIGVIMRLSGWLRQERVL